MDVIACIYNGFCNIVLSHDYFLFSSCATSLKGKGDTVWVSIAQEGGTNSRAKTQRRKGKSLDVFVANHEGGRNSSAKAISRQEGLVPFAPLRLCARSCSLNDGLDRSGGRH